MNLSIDKRHQYLKSVFEIFVLERLIFYGKIAIYVDKNMSKAEIVFIVN